MTSVPRKKIFKNLIAAVKIVIPKTTEEGGELNQNNSKHWCFNGFQSWDLL